MRAALAIPVLALSLGAPARGEDLAARAARSCVLASDLTPPLVVGERRDVTATIRCAPGVHVQRQAPLRVTAAASPGVVLARGRLGWDDVRATRDTQEVAIPVSFTATSAGTAEVRLRLDFFVCSKEWCVRQERELTLPVTVGGAGASQAVTPGATRPAER